MSGIMIIVLFFLYFGSFAVILWVLLDTDNFWAVIPFFFIFLVGTIALAENITNKHKTDELGCPKYEQIEVYRRVP